MVSGTLDWLLAWQAQDQEYGPLYKTVLYVYEKSTFSSILFSPLLLGRLILNLFQVISIACCVFYSHCGNLAVHKSESFGKTSDPSLLAFLKNENGTTWISNFLFMNELKDQICTSWFAPVGSASDYPLLSKWVIYGEVTLASLNSSNLSSHTFIWATSILYFFDHFILQLVCSGSCAGPSDEISPLYSLWATFIGLYIANFVVERSTGYVLTVLCSAYFIPNLSLSSI